MEEKGFLPTVGLFRGLSEEEISRIRRLFKVETRSPEELIRKEGTDAEDLFIVLEGSIDLRFEMPGRETTKEVTIITVKPGNSFGWSALVPPHRYTLSSYCAQEPAVLLRSTRAELEKLFEEQPVIGYRFMKNLTRVIAKRFWAMENELAQHQGASVMHKW